MRGHVRRLILSLFTLSASAQPFDATTNMIVTPVLGSTYTTTNGTNWTPVDALMIRFDVADTNDVAVPQRRLRLPVVRAKLDAAVAQSMRVYNGITTNDAHSGNWPMTNSVIHPFDTNQDDIDKILRHWTVTNTIWHTNYPPVSRVAQSFSDEQVNATWSIRCECGRTMHITVKTVPPTVEMIR